MRFTSSGNSLSSVSVPPFRGSAKPYFTHWLKLGFHLGTTRADTWILTCSRVMMSEAPRRPLTAALAMFTPLFSSLDAPIILFNAKKPPKSDQSPGEC